MPLHVLAALHTIEGSPSVVIVLIHGTWSPNAEWVQPESVLHKDLQRDIPSHASIYNFPWTGRNCAWQRELAALALREQLAASVERYPKVPHILIGHSHGGNIALRAISGVQSLETVKVVCLSTPIIYVIPRLQSDQRRAKESITKYSALLVLALLFVAYLLGVRDNLALIGVFSLVILPIGLFLMASLEKYRVWSLKFCELSSQLITFPSTSLLFLRFMGDEVSFGLSAFQAFQYALNGLIKLQGRIVRKAGRVVDLIMGDGRPIPRLLAVVGAGAGLGFLLFYLTRLGNDLLMATGHPNIADWLSRDNVKILTILLPISAGLALPIVPLALMFVLTVLSAGTCLLMIAVGVWPFGWRLGAASLWTEITVECKRQRKYTLEEFRISARTAALLPCLAQFR